MKKQRKRPERSCIVCREKSDKRDLIRFVKTKDGEIHLDPTGKANGRGAYICTQDKCVNSFLKKNFLERAFKCKVNKETADSLKEELRNYLNKADSEDLK